MHHQVDDIVFATGFDAMTGCSTGSTSPVEAVLTLRDAGRRARRPFKPRQVSNLFTVTGPGSLPVLTNMVVSIIARRAHP